MFFYSLLGYFNLSIKLHLTLILALLLSQNLTRQRKEERIKSWDEVKQKSQLHPSNFSLHESPQPWVWKEERGSGGEVEEQYTFYLILILH